MKKTLNTDAIASELKGSSLFFRQPSVQQPASSRTRAAASMRTASSSAAAVSPPEPSERPPRTGRTPRSLRTLPHPPRRFTRRHAFDIYEDQLEALRRLAMAERMSGGAGSMSQMVRDAIDRFISDAAVDGEQ